MRRRLLIALVSLAVLWLAGTAVAAVLLPRLLLNAQVPHRTEAERSALRARLQGTGRWSLHRVPGGQGVGLDVWWLHRPRSRLALRDLEREGAPLGGALLESPFLDLRDAARNHLRGPLGRWAPIARPALELALIRAGHRAAFDPEAVSPLRASRGLRTPVAYLSGALDSVTPLEGVRALAGSLGDLTVVPDAGHGEAGARVPGGWAAWASARLTRWGLGEN